MANDVKNYTMYGDWIGGEVPVEKLIIASDGSNIYLIQQGQYVKVVKAFGTEDTQGYYYSGDIGDFQEANLPSYNRTTMGAYRVRFNNPNTQQNVNNYRSQLDNIKNSILNTQGKINEQNNIIGMKSSQLEDKQKQVYGQSQEITDKLKLLETRNKMLQLSIDRNIYKKKVIYGLVSVIMLLVIGMLCFYAFFNKAKNVA